MTHLATKISHVTVFRDGARVTRVGVTNLAQGPQKVLVSGITSLARQDSFRVKGKGPATLSTIDVHTVEKVYEPEEDTMQLIEEQKELERRYKTLSDEHEIYENKISRISSMMNEFVGFYGQVFAAQETEIKQLTDMDTKSTKALEDTHEKLRRLEEDMETVATQLEVVRNNLGRIASKRKTMVTYEVEVSLEMSKESEVELEVTYQCHGAKWAPSYDLDLHPGTAELRRIANVINQTDENWQKVTMTVSTATAKPTSAIEGTPFWISEYVPVMAKTEMAQPKMMRMAAPSPRPPPAPEGALRFKGGGAERPGMVEEFAEASETASGISVYEVPKPITIPADGEKHPITLTEEKLESKTIHYWYTEEMAEVVAQDEVTNGDNVILPGKVKVYAEGDYIGETSVHQISPREEFKVGTRVAYDIKAKKELLEKEVERAGLTRGKLRRYYKYRIEVESFSKESVDIEIVDRIPHSNSTAIEVKMEWDRLGLQKHELGMMHWRKMMMPKEKLQLTYDFEVFWEKGVTISPPLP
jgi:uncharacterized protein (TIGR02231 family)